jgi:uroporphyrin-III C-methyltransferase/precorrin-2 dehydrogenase/sirohydrochlorin ferrochelatase
MTGFPAFLRIGGRDALVVGGGPLAAAKARLLVDAGAVVTAIAPAADAALRDLAASGRIRLLARGFAADDVTGKAVVIGAAADAALDRAVSAAAKAAGVPVNVVDAPELSDFTVPAIIRRAPFVIGVSSGGAAPALARRVREAVEQVLPDRLGRLATISREYRGAVKAAIAAPAARRRFWERLFDGPVARAVLGGREDEARRAMLAAINGAAANAPAEGLVSLIGAGPGDPDLLTLRALHALQRADVIVHDRLVAPEILDYARRDAERIDVGKAPGAHRASQAQINDILLAQARAGRRVVRLKGGDPFVFGRGGEELEHLRRFGVAVEIVPGITAATGCAAAAGLPLTHRGLAHGVTFVTGHGADGADAPDWAALARTNHTIAIYMGVATASDTAAKLIAAGRDASTPVAVIENGTRADQRVLTASLGGLGALVRDAAIKGPALLVVGEVAALADAGGLYHEEAALAAAGGTAA